MKTTKCRDIIIKAMAGNRSGWAVFWKRGRAHTEYSRWFPNHKLAIKFIKNLD